MCHTLLLGRGDPPELLIQAHEQTANLSQELLLALDVRITRAQQRGFSMSFLSLALSILL